MLQAVNNGLAFPYINAEHIKDFLVFEGPLLSHFRKLGKDLLVLWSDIDVFLEHKWFVLAVERAALDEFSSGKITLLAVFQQALEVYLTYGEALRPRRFDVLTFTDIPVTHLPSVNSFRGQEERGDPASTY